MYYLGAYRPDLLLNLTATAGRIDGTCGLDLACGPEFADPWVKDTNAHVCCNVFERCRSLRWTWMVPRHYEFSATVNRTL